MRRAVLVDGVRTPFGKGRPGGALHGIHPVDLLATCLDALAERTGIDPALVEDVVTGCVLQVGEQAGNIGRQAVLAAGWPETVPAVTLDRKCGSAQQAVDFAAMAINAGAADVVVAAGVEMMSTVPAKPNRLDRDSLGPRHRARYPQGLVHQGVSAELIAARAGISRAEMDSLALASHRRAAANPAPGLVPATRQLLARAGLAIADIACFEVNEAFASVVLHWIRATGADPERVNPWGGAIAIGHPVGASGGRLFLNGLAALERSGGRFGLVTMCESGGMANATLIERLES